MSKILIIFSIALTIAFLIFRFRRRRLYELAAKIPKVKGSWFGELSHRFIGIEPEDITKILLEIVKEDTPIASAWFGTELAVIVNSPEMFKTIFTSAHCLKKPTLLYDGFFSKNGLLANNGSMQEKHRRILNNSMTPAMLNQLNPIFNEKVKRFVDRIEQKSGLGEFDVFGDVAACALEALMKGNFLNDHDCYRSDVISAFAK
jgi:hypothetical protein